MAKKIKLSARLLWLLAALGSAWMVFGRGASFMHTTGNYASWWEFRLFTFASYYLPVFVFLRIFLFIIEEHFSAEPE